MGGEELTAIMPWNEDEDFTEFSVICGHSPADYRTWYRSAMQKVDDLLREGKAVEFVVIRPAAYKAWLADRGIRWRCGAAMRSISPPRRHIRCRSAILVPKVTPGRELINAHESD